jgi:hypothetical protein
MILSDEIVVVGAIVTSSHVPSVVIMNVMLTSAGDKSLKVKLTTTLLDLILSTVCSSWLSSLRAGVTAWVGMDDFAEF